MRSFGPRSGLFPTKVPSLRLSALDDWLLCWPIGGPYGFAWAMFSGLAIGRRRLGMPRGRCWLDCMEELVSFIFCDPSF